MGATFSSTETRPRRAKSMFEIKNAKGGGFFWTLQGGNNETLCHSEVYASKAGAQNGINAAKRVAPAARVVDRT
jgi:uncharacterized protein